MDNYIRSFVLLQISLMQAGWKISTSRNARPRQITTIGILIEKRPLFTKELVFRNSSLDKSDSMIHNLLLNPLVQRGQERNFKPLTQRLVKIEQTGLTSIGGRNKGREKTERKDLLHNSCSWLAGIGVEA